MSFLDTIKNTISNNSPIKEDTIYNDTINPNEKTLIEKEPTLTNENNEDTTSTTLFDTLGFSLPSLSPTEPKTETTNVITPTDNSISIDSLNIDDLLDTQPSTVENSNTLPSVLPNVEPTPTTNVFASLDNTSSNQVEENTINNMIDNPVLGMNVSTTTSTPDKTLVNDTINNIGTIPSIVDTDPVDSDYQPVTMIPVSEEIEYETPSVIKAFSLYTVYEWIKSFGVFNLVVFTIVLFFLVSVNFFGFVFDIAEILTKFGLRKTDQTFIIIKGITDRIVSITKYSLEMIKRVFIYLFGENKIINNSQNNDTTNDNVETDVDIDKVYRNDNETVEISLKDKMPEKVDVKVLDENHGLLKNKKAYCYIGTDNNYRSCMKVNSKEMCMSGKVYKTLHECKNDS